MTLTRGKKIVTLQEFFLHFGAGWNHPDNREVRVIRTLCPQLQNGMPDIYRDSSVPLDVYGSDSHFASLKSTTGRAGEGCRRMKMCRKTTQPFKVRRPAGIDVAGWLREESLATLSTARFRKFHDHFPVFRSKLACGFSM
jgi:hypothetical protein